MSTSTPNSAPSAVIEPTPLANYFHQRESSLSLMEYRGAQTVAVFTETQQELAAMAEHAGVFDLGYRAGLRLTGSDRIRWTNGMVSNTIVGLEEGQGNYSFLLNAQGRILGDATIYRFSDYLLLETDRSQLPAVLAHLDHFIIMDDVELQPLDASATAIGIAGPRAMELLSGLGLPIPNEGHIVAAQWHSSDIQLSRTRSPLASAFELRLPAAQAPAFWDELVAAGAVSCGSEAVEAWRILSGTPLYGRDITDRHLPQETAQNQALNFSKGCYLGQEIVERIRSRATVHRTFRQFSLDQLPNPIENGQPLPIDAEGAQQNPVGHISSAAEYHLPGFHGVIGLGFIRAEVVERGLPLSSSGITVKVLDAPPASSIS